MQDSPFLAFWDGLNRELLAREIAPARYREAKDFYDSGYRNPREVAGKWIADEPEFDGMGNPLDGCAL